MSLIPHLGFFELLLLAVVALLVVGPQDLPRLMRAVGKVVAQARNLAAEFRASFDQMAAEAEMEEMRQEIESLKQLNPMDEIRDAAEDATKPLNTPSSDQDYDHDIEPEDSDTSETMSGATLPKNEGTA